MILKTLAGFVGGIALLWLVLVATGVWQLWRRRWRGALLPLAVAALIYGVGATPLTALLLASLERPYAGVKIELLPAADAVVMLGGMGGASPHEVFAFQFDAQTERVVTAVELVRQRKGKALVLGGGWSPWVPNPGEGELMKGWLAAWGVSPVPMHVLGLCKDTRDEALRARALADAQGWRRVILVTSASHMRRAEATFRKAGLDVVCFACDFEGLAALQSRWQPLKPPGPGGFVRLDAFLHEVVGWWAYRWRGWV